MAKKSKLKRLEEKLEKLEKQIEKLLDQKKITAEQAMAMRGIAKNEVAKEIEGEKRIYMAKEKRDESKRKKFQGKMIKFRNIFGLEGYLPESVAYDIAKNPANAGLIQFEETPKKEWRRTYLDKNTGEWLTKEEFDKRYKR